MVHLLELVSLERHSEVFKTIENEIHNSYGTCTHFADLQSNLQIAIGGKRIS